MAQMTPGGMERLRNPLSYRLETHDPSRDTKRTPAPGFVRVIYSEKQLPEPQEPPTFKDIEFEDVEATALPQVVEHLLAKGEIGFEPARNLANAWFIATARKHGHVHIEQAPKLSTSK